MTPAEKKKEAGGQAKNEGEGGQKAVTAWPANGALVKQRRFILAIALKIADRGEGEIFTAGAAGGGKKVYNTTAGGGAVGGAEEEISDTAITSSTSRTT